MGSEDSIGADSIDWARRHIEKHGDTDIFPVPFEYETLPAAWAEIREDLGALNLSSFSARGCLTFLVPKAELGFRVAHQLDPLDAIIYTALAYEIGENIESARIPVEKNVACSYRISPTPCGDFFPRDNGWESYSEQSLNLAIDNEYVLHADITDFYNQIYHHRLQSALEQAGVAPQRAVNVERFLGRYTAKQSQGIPVGPSASHVLAEACLNDVDHTLLDKRYEFTRYIDNYRIFGGDRVSGLMALHDLTDYLHAAHRLSIQDSKTRIERTECLLSRLREDPELKEQEEKERAIEEIMTGIRENAGYVTEIQEIDDADLNRELGKRLGSLLEEALVQRPVKYGMIRHVLRSAQAMRVRTLYPIVLKNLESLIPVFRDVCTYFVKTLSGERSRAREVGSHLLDVARNSDYAWCAYVRIWVLHLFQLRPALADYSEAAALARLAETSLGIRPMALLARAYEKVHWVRERKERIDNLSPWDRRAVIWAGSILPGAERRKWLDLLKDDTTDLLERAVVLHLKSRG